MATRGPKPGSLGARRNAERMRKLHADPEFKAAHRERSSERMRKLNADPEFKAATSERMRKLNADPEFKAATSERMRKLRADPEFKAATSERMRKLHADPEFKARQHPWLASLSAKERADYELLRNVLGKKEARAIIERQRHKETAIPQTPTRRPAIGRGWAA